MIVRVRCSQGTWRIEIPGPSSRIGELKAAIEAQKSVASDAQVLSAEPSGAAPLDDGATLEACGLGANGSMVFLAVAADRRDDVALPPPPTAKDDVGVRGAARVKIGADGSIVATEYDDYTSAKGFRPGMAALGDIKKSWTLTDFLEMDDQFVFKVKRQEDKHCAAVSLDAGACVSFQGYVQQLGWRQQRVGFLYGTFDDGEARVEAVYEPPQDCSENGFVLLEDDKAEAVAQLAQLLGLVRVGWIFACPPREDGFVFSGEEAIQAAMEQLEAADGVAETPYVSVRVTVNEKGEANFEAYQVSQQCMAMVAEGALQGGTRERRSQLQRLLSRPFFTRFGWFLDGRSSLGALSKRGCFFRNARARNTHVGATLHHARPAQARSRRTRTTRPRASSTRPSRPSSRASARRT